MESKSFRKWVGGSAIALATVGGGVVAVAAGGSSGSVGPDRVYGDAAFADASAQVHIVRTGTGGTNVTLHMMGVDADPGRTFGAHIHQSPCGPFGTDAGGHYQHAGASCSLEDREVWLDFTINDESHHRAEPVRLGELQVWDIVNDSLLDHPFHLHGFFFQVLEVNGSPPAFRSWEDTVNIPAQGRVRIAWRADDRPGEWMYHCHILEHHAGGMMAHFEVVP